MSRSILCDNENPRCYYCPNVSELHPHHCLYGIYRAKADQYGLWVYLCPEHHTKGPFAVHSHKGRARAVELQNLAQSKFEEIYGHDRFIAEFGRNFLGVN